MTIETTLLKQIIECAILAAGEPVSVERLQQLFDDQDQPSIKEIRDTLEILATEYIERGLILQEVASGFTIQIKPEMQRWISKLWEKRPPRYSRALLETLALIAYRQPITRSEIEEVRGVNIASTTFKILLEREWIRVVGHRDVPGKPALYATTKQFLDYFNLKGLNELPALVDLQATLVSLQENPQLENRSEEEIDADEVDSVQTTIEMPAIGLAQQENEIDEEVIT